MQRPRGLPPGAAQAGAPPGELIAPVPFGRVASTERVGGFDPLTRGGTGRPRFPSHKSLADLKIVAPGDRDHARDAAGVLFALLVESGPKPHTAGRWTHESHSTRRHLLPHAPGLAF